MTYCIIQATAANEEEAQKIAKHLVEKKLIACCSIIPKVTSIYTWRGEISEDNEALMIMKTKTQLYSQAEEEIKKLHSYEVPEIISIPINTGSKEYLSWLEEQI